MAFLGPAQWEVRTTGSDANGGAFDPTSGTPGTDYSQQDAAQIAYTDMVIGAGTSTFTSVANPPAASLVGNFINVTGGTGFTVQRVQVISVAAGVATCDKSLGTAASTGGTGNMGGALLTLAVAVASTGAVAANTIHLKAGTYTLTSATALGGSGTAAGGTIRVRGFSATHGDGGTSPVITSSSSGVNLINSGGQDHLRWDIVKFTHTGATRGVAFFGSTGVSQNWAVVNCTFDGVLSAIDGDNITNFPIIGNLIRSEIKNCTGDGIRAPFSISRCHIHDNTGDGYGRVTHPSSGQPGTIAIMNSVIADNGGDGVDLGSQSSERWSVVISGCDIYSNTEDGIQVGSTGFVNLTVEDCILTDNGGYGINSALSTLVFEDYNAFYNNTSGARNNVATGANSVALSGDPFTNAASDDYTLNNTAGAGAACRAAGSPGTLPGATGTGYRDIGPFQHQDAASGGIAKMAGEGGGFVG